MPQMAPMSWLILFLMFCSALMVMSTINYYIYTPKIEKSESKKTQQEKINWKW